MPAVIPKFQRLYYCRYGFNGDRQICLFLGYRGDGYVVQKWRANSGRRTDRLVIAKTDLLAAASRADVQKARVQINLMN